MTTLRTGFISLKNNWGENIHSITIRHRRGNNPNRQEQEIFTDITSGELRRKLMEFKYETSVGSPYDYWWIKFITESGRTYTIKHNFYCSVTSRDDGNVFLHLDGDHKKMHVTLSSSSYCRVSIFKE
ncbi:hypothetical protein [Pectobacterium brasiliense]|uniref:hypothetical protein n=1 Tax=Pectobacterium brasiliense TaxID=180957 RepID=UPI0013DF4E01|nr:hypothetical protein [Pectobacterium brasiliense]